VWRNVVDTLGRILNRARNYAEDDKPRCQLQIHVKQLLQVEELELSELNVCVTALGCSPLKFNKVSQRDVIGYSKRKFYQAENALKCKLSKRLDVDPEVLTLTDAEKICQKCMDLDDLIISMKEKCAVSTRQGKIQILTMAPPSWSIEQTAREFKVSQYMVRKVRDLKKSGGVLAEPTGKRGKELSADIQKQVPYSSY
jgi:hypothetical protein